MSIKHRLGKLEHKASRSGRLLTIRPGDPSPVPEALARCASVVVIYAPSTDPEPLPVGPRTIVYIPDNCRDRL
ncbi:MAG: hypothetical protein PHT19_10375 [Methylococcus sp.]|nr:hypothetical protein [Methylococcus sp.]